MVIARAHLERIPDICTITLVIVHLEGSFQMADRMRHIIGILIFRTPSSCRCKLLNHMIDLFIRPLFEDSPITRSTNEEDIDNAAQYTAACSSHIIVNIAVDIGIDCSTA